MKQVSTHFLRLVILLIATGALALCVFALPSIWRGGSEEFPMAGNALFLIMVGMYVTAVPFLFSLWQALKLLRHIDQNKAFSDVSVQAVKNIKYCWIMIAVLYVAGVPLLIPIAEADDAPGLVLIGMAVACAPIAVAVFAAVLQKLLQNAINIQSENDLTV